jgi:hypothetical protein
VVETGQRQVLFLERVALCTGCEWDEDKKDKHWLIIKDEDEYGRGRQYTWTLEASHTKEEVEQFCVPGSLVVLEALDDWDRCYAANGDKPVNETQWEEFRLWKIVKE